MKPGFTDRRSFPQKLLLFAGARHGVPVLSDVPRLMAGHSPALANPVGYATISWPRDRFPEALKTISELGYQGVQLLGWVSKEYAGPKTASLRQRLLDLKLKPVSLSCAKVALDPDSAANENSAVSAYAAFFRDLGGLYLQVTDGGKPTKEYSQASIKALGDRMNALGKLAQDNGLLLGYHPHFNSIGETREGLGRVLDATDPRYVKLIADVAHLTLGGADPAEAIRTYHQRLIFCHFKDVRQDVAKLARQDRNLVHYKMPHFCEIGRGVVDFPAILRAFRDVDFRGWVIVELDGYEPPPGGPEESARVNLEAIKKLGFL